MPETKETAQNKMGVMPVPRLLLNMGIPMIISMLVQALYNFIDTFFVSNIPDTATVSEMGDKAVNALTLAYPIQMIMIAVTVGIGIATNSLLAKNLGMKNRETASRVAGNSIFICFIFLLLIMLFGIFLAEPFIASQTSDATIIELGTSYLRIVTILSFGTIGYMCIEKIVMGCGNTRATMIGQLSGAVINIILDPILIFGLLGFPELGVVGAALATVIGQVCSLLIICYFLFFRTKEIDKRFKYVLPNRKVLTEMSPIAVPAVVMQILTPIMNYGMNLILGSISSYAVTAYGVYYRIQYFMYMAIYGMNNASIAVTAFNFGNRHRERIKLSLRYSLLYTIIMMVVGTVLIQIFTHQVIGLFSVAEESADLTVFAFRIATIGFTFGGVNIILQGYMQALGAAVRSLIISALRMVVIVFPLAYLLSILNPSGELVWIALPAAEITALIVDVIFVRQVNSQRLNKIPQ